MAINVANQTKAQETNLENNFKTWFMPCPNVYSEDKNYLFDICIDGDNEKRLYRTTDASKSFKFQTPIEAGPNDVKVWGDNHSEEEVHGWRGHFFLNNVPIMDDTDKKILKDLLPDGVIGTNDKMILIAVP